MIRLFCKSIPDDKHSNTQYIKQEYNSLCGRKKKEKNIFGEGGGEGGERERENYKIILTNKGKRQHNDYITIYV